MQAVVRSPEFDLITQLFCCTVRTEPEEKIRVNSGTEIAKGGRSSNGAIAMPIPPPRKARAQAARKHKTIATIDWLGLWALSLGFCAIVLAGIADFMGEDKIGAAFILVGRRGHHCFDSLWGR